MDAYYQIIKYVHEFNGHKAVDTTVYQLSNYCYFPHMRREVDSSIIACAECAQKVRGQSDQRHTLSYTMPSSFATHT